MMDGFDVTRKSGRPVRIGLDNTTYGKQIQDAAGVVKSQVLSGFVLIFSSGQKPSVSSKTARLES